MANQAYQMALVTQDSLDSYIRSANSYPMLTPEEERGLAERLHYKGEIVAAKGLILSHLRFVVHVARGYSGYGLPMADLVQEGNIGLMKAVKRFNPEKGVRLISFAVHWIKAEIHEFILRNWRIVKIATTKAQRKLFAKIPDASHHKIFDLISETLKDAGLEALSPQVKATLERASEIGRINRKKRIEDGKIDPKPSEILTDT